MSKEKEGCDPRTSALRAKTFGVPTLKSSTVTKTRCYRISFKHRFKINTAMYIYVLDMVVKPLMYRVVVGLEYAFQQNTAQESHKYGLTMLTHAMPWVSMDNDQYEQ